MRTKRKSVEPAPRPQHRWSTEFPQYCLDCKFGHEQYELLKQETSVVVPCAAASSPVARPQPDAIIQAAQELSEAAWIKMACYCTNCPEPTIQAAKRLKELLKQWNSSATLSQAQSLSSGFGSYTSSVRVRGEAQVSIEPAARVEQPTPLTNCIHCGQYPFKLTAPVVEQRELSEDERMAIQIEKILKRFGTIENFFDHMNEQARGKK